MEQTVCDSSTLLIVIVNYRTAGLTISCVESLVDEVRCLDGTRVCMVEGGSGDDSADVLSRAIHDRGWDSWVSLLTLVENRGFAAGNNAAIAPALKSVNPPRYLHLLNPDTVVRPGAITSLVRFLDEHPDVGFAGSRLEEPNGTPQHGAFRFPGALSEFENGIRMGLISRLLARWTTCIPQPAEACQVGWVTGASMMVRREVFEDVGLLDDGYFLYFEETDFALRAARNGWTSWHVPQSRVMHWGGVSTGTLRLNPTPKRTPAYWFDSRHRYFMRNYGPAKKALVDIAWATGYVFYLLESFLLRRTKQLPPHLMRDFLRYNSLLWTGQRTVR